MVRFSHMLYLQWFCILLVSGFTKSGPEYCKEIVKDRKLIVINDPELIKHYMSLCNKPEIIFSEVTLQMNNLGTLNAEFLRNLNTEYLDLSKNKLESIEENVFKSVQHYLASLYLDFNELNDLPSFRSLVNLKTLSLSNNKIVNVGDIFPDSIETIYMERNKITEIKVSFSRLQNLKYLYLQENSIINIDTNLYQLKQSMLVDLSRQRGQFKIENFFIETDSNVTFMLNSNKIVFDDKKALLNKNTRIDNKRRPTFILSNVTLNGINPCYLFQLVDSNLKLTNVILNSTEDIKCNCKLVNYLNERVNNLNVSCSEGGFDESNCDKNDKYLTNICDFSKTNHIETKQHPIWFYLFLMESSVICCGLVIAVIVIVIKFVCLKFQKAEDKRQGTAAVELQTNHNEPVCQKDNFEDLYTLPKTVENNLTNNDYVHSDA